MSGDVFSYFGSMEERNHKPLLVQTFSNELKGVSDANDILAFLKTATVDDFRKLPTYNPSIITNGPATALFAPVVERQFNKKDSKCKQSLKFALLNQFSELYIIATLAKLKGSGKGEANKSTNPFITEDPIEIIKKTKLNKDLMFGFTSLVHKLKIDLFPLIQSN